MTTTPAEQDVTEVLTQDHREFLSLVDEIRATSDPERRRELADTMIAEIVRHAVAEEMHVYPAMEEHLPDGERAVAHDKQEHNELEQTMKELEGTDAASPRFLELVDSMEAQLRDHISDEEGEQFPVLRQRVPRDQLLDMARKVETAKRIAPTRPHPSAPNERPFHLVAGPGVGMVDRLRDTLSGRDV